VGIAKPVETVEITFMELLASTSSVITGLADRLSPVAAERAARLHSPSAYRSFVAAHALKSYATFGRTAPHGSLSLSHTHGLAVCAASSGAHMGVDAEYVDPHSDYELVAQEILASSEQRRFERTHRSRRREQFFRLWTLKEAFSKATQLGLGLDFRSVEFSLDPLRLIACPQGLGSLYDWTFEERPLGNSHRIALAVRRSPSTCITVSWQGFSARQLTTLFDSRGEA
jgi:4'-phosphopantetheinyl transferase